MHDPISNAPAARPAKKTVRQLILRPTGDPATVHTANGSNGTGIVDQYLDDASKTNLTVLMGGGRKWFLPSPTSFTNGFGGANFNGSARTTGTDYTTPLDIQAGWGAAPGAIDTGRNLINDFTTAGWTYAPDRATLNSIGTPSKLLGLFSLSNMNIAKDKIDGRRGAFPTTTATTTVVQNYGFPDQPMLDEMAGKALQVLDANSPNGFVLMVEGASIDKQAHMMDSTHWMVDTVEFDKAVQKSFLQNPAWEADFFVDEGEKGGRRPPFLAR